MFFIVFIIFVVLLTYGLRSSNDVLVWSSVAGLIIVTAFCFLDFISDDEEEDDEPDSLKDVLLKVPVPPLSQEADDGLMGNDEVIINYG